MMAAETTVAVGPAYSIVSAAILLTDGGEEELRGRLLESSSSSMDRGESERTFGLECRNKAAGK